MPMTRQQAELAVDRDARLRGLGPNREAAIRKVMQMDPDQLVGNVPAGSPLARNVTRQTAISAAMGGPEEPRMVTPAAPAPVRPGIPIMAPRPEARQLMPADVRRMAAREEAGMSEPEPETAPAPAPVRPAPAAAAASGYVSPMRLAMKETERELGLLNYNRKRIADEGKPENPELELAINLAERRLDQQRSIANAEEGAAIDPERAALLARQEGRIKGREEQVGREEKNALSDALIKGGLALMNPQRGANFLAALSGGLGQGLETYDAAKAKAVEARARLGAETDALALQKFDALDKARAVARQSILEGKQIDERELRMAGMTDEQMERAATLQARIQKTKAEASKAQTQADYEPAVIESEIGYRGAMGTAANMRAASSSDGDGVSATARFNAAEDAKKKAIERQDTVREKFQAWKESESGSGNLRSGPEWAAYQAELRIYRLLRKQAGLEGVLPDLGATSPGERAKPKAKPKAGSKGGLPADVAAKYGL